MSHRCAFGPSFCFRNASIAADRMNVWIELYRISARGPQLYALSVNATERIPGVPPDAVNTLLAKDVFSLTNVYCPVPVATAGAPLPIPVAMLSASRNVT